MVVINKCMIINNKITHNSEYHTWFKHECRTVCLFKMELSLTVKPFGICQDRRPRVELKGTAASTIFHN